jgi:hypothetical protein
MDSQSAQRVPPRWVSTLTVLTIHHDRVVVEASRSMKDGQVEQSLFGQGGKTTPCGYSLEHF